MGLLGACGAPEAAPVPPASAVAIAASSRATEPATTATGTSGPGDGAAAVAVETGWVREHPELTRLFGGVRACARKESFMPALDGSRETIHSYELYSPATAQDDLERGFRRSAGELGHVVKDTPSGRGFWDQASGISAYVSDARIDVLFKIADPPAKAAGPPATALGFETWPMLAGLADATWKSIRLEKYTDGAGLSATLEVAAAGRGAIERWAQQHNLVRGADDWIQKWQPAPTPRAGIAIMFAASGAIDVVETIGGQLAGDACKDSPSRKKEVAPKLPPAAKATDDELMKQMLGN